LENRMVIGSVDESLKLFGQNDRNVRMLNQQLTSVKLIPRGNELIIRGEKDDVENASRIVLQLIDIAKSGREVEERDVGNTVRSNTMPGPALKRAAEYEIPTQKKVIHPKTAGQQKYLQSIQENDLIFSIGPAGTGKTYLAMAMAVKSLLGREIGRIILTRPVVEAGEKLGFLPGDINAKVDPYFRPLYDALYEMMEVEKLTNFIEKGIIEIAPLAFMRGRTLNDSFIILDEAQNTTREQMKMFLTRLGFGSRAVITGDITQVDLEDDKESGLVQIQGVLKGIKGISFAYLTQEDVVRHELVQKIVRAYEQYSANNKG